MGKGRRNRGSRQTLRPHEALYAKAAKQQKVAGGFAVAALVTMVLGMFLPAWSIVVMADNLEASKYMAEEIAVLAPILPVGRLALTLIVIGVFAGAILLWRRRPALSVIGAALCAAGDACLVYFAVVLGRVFAYDALEQRGLAFGDLLIRYYVLLLPLLLLAAALAFGFAAHKKRTVAQTMENASDTAPTVTLGDEEDL